jgi:hypothetical protein
MTEDIIDRLRASADTRDWTGSATADLQRTAADEIERLRKQTLLAPSISWDGFLVSGMQESIDEVCRLIDLERRGHK